MVLFGDANGRRFAGSVVGSQRKKIVAEDRSHRNSSLTLAL